ncbi:MAG: pyruvate dehydrogenase complex dihydrolipoamide acetyltransferase [Bacteroidota bacterium]
MAEVLTMPRMSDTMEEGNILGWLVKVGDQVEAGDVLAEVETDKATMELESPYDGTLLYIGVAEGAVPIDAVLAVIGDAGEDYAEDLKAAEAEAAASGAKASEATEETQQPAETSHAMPVESAPSTAAVDSNEKLKASPLAKSMAKVSGIDLNQVKGSGDGGRIIKRDIEAFIEKGPSKAAPAAISLVPQGASFVDEGISQMRKTIARRLSESKFGAPHFYLTMEIDMDHAIAARKQINEVSEVRISYNDIIVKASALALRKHQNVNSSWLGDKIRRNQHINIGVAVAVDEGLLVPVVKNADFKTLSQIKAEVKELAGKAREKKLSLDEMQGNTFTISNLGMFDIDEFTAIINPPDACILAVGSIVEKPVVKDGQIVVGNIMKVTLSCDHRVVDGVTGAEFLQTLKTYLEDPVRMLI